MKLLFPGCQRNQSILFPVNNPYHQAAPTRLSGHSCKCTDKQYKRSDVSHISLSALASSKTRIECKILLLTFKAFNGQALAYLKELIVQSFTLQRGTRQRCPLSPSLVIIVIEQLAAVNCQNTHIDGIQTLNAHHKISLFAADTVYCCFYKI